MPAVAFLRNLNQGQRGMPTGADLSAAFVAAGAAAARTVRANGTIAFDAAEPQRCTDEAVAALAARSSWRDVGIALDATTLRDALDHVPTDDARWELSVFTADPAVRVPVPLAGRRCEVVAIGAGWALTRNERDRESFATPTLERALDRPVTSRGVATVRLALLPG